MKVSELISLLKDQDPNSAIVIQNANYCSFYEIKKIMTLPLDVPELYQEKTQCVILVKED